MFLPEPASSAVDAVRAVVDPVQFGLIAAHVTLGKDEELDGLSPAVLGGRISELRIAPVTLMFGAPRGFYEHGLIMPCVAGAQAFRHLRQQLFGSASVRPAEPHITLAHPRNPKAAGNCIENAAALQNGLVVTLDAISHIEQVAGEAWRVFAVTSLKTSA